MEELYVALDEDFAWFAAVCRSYDSCHFELVHETTGAVVSYGEFALYHGGGALLGLHDETCYFFKHGVEVLHIGICRACVVAVHGYWWQGCWAEVALLTCYVACDGFDFGGIDKGTLYAYWLGSVEYEHVALAYELLGSAAVEYGTAVYHGTYFECHTGWEVGLDGAGDDVGGGSLCGYNHVYAHGACQLGYAADGELDFLACGHDEVAKLIDDYDDVGHEAVSVVGVEVARLELLVVFA